MSVELRVEGPIATLTIARPERRNALDTETAREMARRLGEVASDESVLLLVLRGKGDHFCAGADLIERRAMTLDGWKEQHRVLEDAFSALRGLPQPTLAGVTGWALGGGFEAALSCDLIVADETARFGLPEVKIGIIPGCGGTQLLPRRLPRAVALRLLYTGEPIGAREALALGLVSSLAAAGEVDVEVSRIAQRIAVNSPVSLRALKEALSQGEGLPLEEAVGCELRAWYEAVEGPDYPEGLAAFAARREPVFSRPGAKGGMPQ